MDCFMIYQKFKNYKFYTIDGYVSNDILLVTINDLPNVA